MPPVTKRVKINGIKISSEFVLLHLPRLKHSSPAPFLYLLKRLSENKINLPFVSTINLSDQYGMSCCVSSMDIGKVRQIINSIESIEKHINYIENVGMISVFPHQSRIEIFGTLLHVIGMNQLIVYGLASSISSIFFITDYVDMEKAVACLKKCFGLPDNYAPIKGS